MDLRKEREELFDEDFKCKSQDIQRVYAFCEELTNITDILVGNKFGMMYEYLPKVYRGVIKQFELQGL